MAKVILISSNFEPGDEVIATAVGEASTELALLMNEGAKSINGLMGHVGIIDVALLLHEDGTVEVLS